MGVVDRCIGAKFSCSNSPARGNGTALFQTPLGSNSTYIPSAPSLPTADQIYYGELVSAILFSIVQCQLSLFIGLNGVDIFDICTFDLCTFDLCTFYVIRKSGVVTRYY